MRQLREIGVTGFSTFFIDVAMGILTILFNRQIMRYLGADALAIYGPVINISTFVQCCAYSVGQAAQPIISTNFGAHPRRAPAGAGVVRGVLYFLDGAEPRLAEHLYSHLHAADGGNPRHGAGYRPDVCRVVPAAAEYFLHVLFSGHPQAGRCVFCLRRAGARHHGALILLLPAVLGPTAIWWAMPVTELLVACYAAAAMRRATRALPSC